MTRPARAWVLASAHNEQVNPPYRPASARCLVAGLLTIVLAGCSGGSGPENAAGLGFVAGDGSAQVLAGDDRRPAPEVGGETLDGGRLDLVELRGQVVVLNFWASWCAPCRAETPLLERVAQATRSDGVRFVGVNMKDDRGPAQATQRNLEVSYPSLYDQPGRIAARFHDTMPPSAIPTTLVLDRDGRVAARFLGPVTQERLQPVVEQLAAETA